MHINRFTEISIGAIVVIVAAVIGSYLTAKYTYDFQSKLLEKQITAQKELMAEQLKLQERLLERQLKFEKINIKEAREFQRIRDSRNR